MVAAMGGRCVVCRYDRCCDALEFHHRDPANKDFALSAIRVTPRAWKLIAQELRKCVLLCSNCHREVHAGLVTIPDDARSFDPLWDDYRLIERRRCRICRTVVPVGNQEYCSVPCAIKGRQKIDWNQIDLPALAANRSNSAIARLLGVSDVTVAKRLKALGVAPSRGTAPRLTLVSPWVNNPDPSLAGPLGT